MLLCYVQDSDSLSVMAESKENTDWLLEKGAYHILTKFIVIYRNKDYCQHPWSIHSYIRKTMKMFPVIKGFQV